MVTRDYELGFILNPEVNEEQTEAILNRIRQIVANHGGQVVKENQWGRRRLSYPIEHHRDGYYVFIDMILTPETVAELDRSLKVSEEVLRHLMKRRDAKAVQKEREERERREAAAAETTSPNPADVVAAAAEEAVLEAAADAAVESDEMATPALGEEEVVDVPPAIGEVETM